MKNIKTLAAAIAPTVQEALMYDMSQAIINGLRRTNLNGF